MIIGLQVKGTFNQHIGFIEPIGPIRQCVAERIQRIGIVGLPRKNVGEVAFEQRNSIELLGQHRPRVKQIGVLRKLIQGKVVDLHRLLESLQAHQDFGFGPVDPDGLAQVATAQSVQMRTCLRNAVHLREQDRNAQVGV